MKNIFLFGYTIILFFCLFSCSPDTQVKEENSNYYTEQYRPQVHFSPQAKWMNDPNGLVYHEGEYHLFYQYYPDSTVWGPMHWGHAISIDLVHWEHLPIALYPDSLGYIFSGSAVVDIDNTAGFAKDGETAMVAMFTHHDIEGEQAGTLDFQTQSIAYSTDRGRTWTKYEGNPVIPNPGIKDFRDPKVIWDNERSQWVMVLAAYDKAMFYTSSNLKEWTYASSFGIEGDQRLWECPDLFPMKVEGSDESKWVLITSIQKEGPNGGTATSYFVGDFDGQNFISDPEKQEWLDYGKDNYAFVTWSGIPDSLNRKIGIGWMSNWQYAQVVPSKKWRGAMTVPRELKLIQDGNLYRLTNVPVQEFKSLERSSIEVFNLPEIAMNTYELPKGNGLYRFKLRCDEPMSTMRIRLRNSVGEWLEFGYFANAEYYFIDRRNAGKDDFQADFRGYHTGYALYPKDDILMDIIIDHSSIELFADNGQCAMTDIFFLTEPFDRVELVAACADLEFEVIDLDGIW